ncbi:hypothetical protein SAMN04487936_103331 [Halobacillus dabanensis]|uniref:Uncharacterized protein n=1 Tax=Halobacillus dabanensis TaxID=240302 RepID=A0A1I3TCI7_HALDA|nr:hypothetical protein [Halobacillus dabanensis]SFJ68675.1 hypothetical protein SAMN04487936_103331 [Halobacillus dabanensis]
MKVKLWILPAFLLLLIGCMEEEYPEQTNGEQDETAEEGMQEGEIAKEEDPREYTAENVYQWLKTLIF